MQRSGASDQFFLFSRFSQNYTKLAMLPTKAFIGKSKINSVKKDSLSGDKTHDLLVFTLMPCCLERISVN